MLFSNVYAPAALLLVVQSFCLANPIVSDKGLQERADEDVLILGEPEMADAVEKRSPYPIPEFEDLEVRQASSDQQEGLRLHNAVRTSKGLPTLTWDSTLEANAKAWATEIARRDVLEHSTSAQRPNQGENLAYQRSSRPITTPIAIGVKAWLDEEPIYKNEPIPQGNFAGYGHYTQCVWKSTTKVGIATAAAANGGVYTVARYSPPGNYYGQRPF